jgi:predicted DNA-binding transcriptional regulator AlpA
MAEELSNREFLTLGEAAQFARLSVRSLQRQIAVGEGPPLIRLTSRRILFGRKDLTDWLEKKRQRPTAYG